VKVRRSRPARGGVGTLVSSAASPSAHAPPPPASSVSLAAGDRATAPANHDPEPATVAMRAISKSFDGQLANDAIDLDVRPGEIHALLGENGAGKTTLMNILSGFLQPDAGRVSVGNAALDFRSPRDALRHGIGMVHQHSVLVPTLTVAENVVLGQESNWQLKMPRKEIHRRVAACGEHYGLAVDPRALVSSLSVDQVQRVEILRLLYKDASTLILDEPTAVLARLHVDQLFATLRSLRERGCGVVIVTHKLDEVLELADCATVLRRGRVVEVVERECFNEDALTEALVGHSLSPIVRRESRAENGDARVVYAVEGLSVNGDRHPDAVAELSFEIKAGEILGLAGVEGNGQMELVEALAGVRPFSGGLVRIGPNALEQADPGQLDRLGVGVVSGERLRWDVFPELSAAENLLLSAIAEGRGGYTSWGFLRGRKIESAARSQLADFDVRPSDPQRIVGTFSGGNQQRVVLARELSRKPAVLIAAYPTRGLDIAAARFVQKTLLGLRQAGTAVLLVSADLDELLALSDRVGVLYRGRLSYMSPTASADRRAMAAALVGLSRAETRRPTQELRE
jgi:ABC-type uncharacterized transport system ATPase subunit